VRDRAQIKKLGSDENVNPRRKGERQAHKGQLLNEHGKKGTKLECPIKLLTT